MNRAEILDAMVQTGLYLVTEDGVAAEERLAAVAQALAGGARIVQLRDKTTPRRRLIAEAKRMRELCARNRAAFIVNDDVAVAWLSDADGVHLGQDDLPAEDARRVLGESKVIGLSISAVLEAEEADRLPVDYIGVGAIYATPTKTDAELGGLGLLRTVRGVTKKPLVAIGGIDSTNAAEVFEAGADAVAVVRAVFAQDDVSSAVAGLLRQASIVKRERKG